VISAAHSSLINAIRRMLQGSCWQRCRVVGIFPNDAAIKRLVGAVLLEQDEHWQLEGRLMFSAESMAEIPALEDLPAQACLQEATA